MTLDAVRAWVEMMGWVLVVAGLFNFGVVVVLGSVDRYRQKEKGDPSPDHLSQAPDQVGPGP